jgi:hypothetical protein
MNSFVTQKFTWLERLSILIFDFLTGGSTGLDIFFFGNWLFVGFWIVI